MRRMIPLLTLALFACDVDEDSGEEEGGEDVIAEACEHMADGPAVPGTVVETNADSPVTVNKAHHRIDLTLFMEEENVHSGAVAFEADVAGQYAFYVDTDLVFEVQTADLTDVSLDGTADVECASVAKEYLVTLDVGSYVLIFSRSTVADISLVHESLTVE